MPRRPRPDHRVPPRGTSSLSQIRSTSNKQLKNGGQGKLLEKVAHHHQKSEEQSDKFENESSVGSSNEGSLDSADEDADAPRISQWVDDDELDGLSGEESEEDEKPETGPSQLEKIQTSLSDLPFGTLRNAQRVLRQAESSADSEPDDDEIEGSVPESGDDLSIAQSSRDRQIELRTKARKDIAKRSNKHAPIEVTSKKPVSRFRQIVEVTKLESRDPRFLPTTGEFKSEKFQQNYQFLADSHTNELNTLRDNLKRARKMLDNAPRHLRNDYETEVKRLELAVKRAESLVNREHMDRVQRDALLKVSRDEKEKRKQGKGNWFLKKSEKRDLLTRARYDALAAEGGNRAVKKAIEKKQKKISQKEKKSRPFPKSGPIGEGPKRRSASSENEARKRRRVG